MTPREAAGLVWGCLLLVLTHSVACTEASRSDRTATGDAPGNAAQRSRELRAVALPDLSRTAATVQAQITERYSAFQQRIAASSLPPAERANEYGDMGKLFLAADLLDVAEACFLNASALAATDMRWPYFLGHLHRKQGALETSAEFFEAARRLDPSHFATSIWSGEVHLAREDPNQAEPHFARALSMQPRSAAALAGIGRAALGKRDFARAVTYLEQSLSIDADAAVVHYATGMAYRGLGQQEKAEAHLRQKAGGDVLVPDPLMQDVQQLLQSAPAFESLGIRALANGEPKAAVGYFEKGLALAPEDPSLHQRLGTALYLTGAPDAARAHFETALRLSPSFAPAHYSLGVLLASSGRYPEAVERFSAAATHDRHYVEPRLQMADILRHTGRPQQALRYYAEVLQIDPRSVEGQFGEALALVALKRYRDAHRRLESAVVAHPDERELTHVFARLLAAAPDDRIRDGARALQLVRPLLERDRNVEFGETLAMALAETGAYDEAVSLQRDLIVDAERSDRRDVMPRLAANLERYEHRQPCRTPWPADQLP